MRRWRNTKWYGELLDFFDTVEKDSLFWGSVESD
jgi:hypothetical protein